jgi:hypothetical protein
MTQAIDNAGKSRELYIIVAWMYKAFATFSKK